MLTRRLTLIATLVVAATAALATPSVASPDDGITDAPPVDEQPAPGRRTGPPVEMRGATAAVVLKVSGTADEVASNAGLTVSELTSTLQDDPTMFVTSDGMVGYAEPAALGADPDPDALAALAAGELPADVFSLSSRPSSSKVIYLDFDGHITVGDYWNSTYGVSPIVSSPFDIDGNTSTFSTAERAAIHEVWLRVAEDYAPFDVNVTTQDPGTNGLRRTSGSDQHYGTRVVITSSDWYHAAGGGRIGGIALLSVFASSVDHAAFVFAGNLSNNAKNIAEATAHEAGHNFGLHHDGRGSSTYYGGHGQWGPLMGTGYGRAVSQWSRGEYSLATNQEDDLAKIAAYTAWVVDDHSDAFSEPTVVGYESSTGGLIGRTGDVDHFAVDAEAGKLEVTLTPTAVGSNLYAGVRVMDAGGEIIAAGTPAGPAGWSATATATVPAGRYTIEVAPLSYQTHDTGFGIYGSLGEYTLTVAARGPSTTPPPPTVPPPTTTVPATDGPPTTTPPPTTVPPADPPLADDGPAQLSPIDPRRVVDTRSGIGGSSRLAAGGTVPVVVAGRHGVPESATAAVITVTAVRPADAGYLTVHPCSVDRSPTSTVNYAAGLVSANSTIATLDGHGRICVYTHAESDVLVDITGWLGPTGETRLDPIGPTRAADTRIGHGGSHRLAAGDVMTLDLGSHLRFGTRAVALNVTAVRPDDVGYLTVYPCASSRPATSTLNYVAGDIRPNNVIVGVTGRQVCIYTHAATDVLVDLVGSFGATGLGYHPVNPQRVLDTRLTDMALLPDSTVLYGVATSEVTPDRPAAASVNITAVGHSATGHVTTYDCATRRTTSTLNQLVGQVAANGAIVPLTDRAASCAWSSSGGHLIVDMNGWWVP